jgi:O-antigen ligase
LPPPLALLLCAGFIIFLLRLTRQQFPEATRRLWIPTLWLLTVSTKAISTWFGAPASSLEDGSALDRNFLIILMCIAIWMLSKRKFVPSGVLKENVWLVVLLVFMFVSISWSPVPFVSLKRWVREIIAIVMGFVILTEEDPRRAIECVIKRTVYILIPLSVLLIKYFPQFGIDYVGWTGAEMWVGVTDQKNELGQLTCLAAFFLIWGLQKRWRARKGPNIRFLTLADMTVLATAVYLTKGSEAGYSATSIVMLAIGLITYAGLLFLKTKGKIVSRSLITVYFLVLIAYGTATPMIGRLPAGDVSARLGRDSTLTERTVNWAALVPVAMSRPLLGHGIGGFWTSDKIGKFYYPAHNGFLEIVLVLGLVGLLLFSVFLIASAHKAQNLLTENYDWAVLWICWLAMALVNNIAESSLNSFGNIMMAIPLWMTVIYKRPRQDDRESIKL